MTTRTRWLVLILWGLITLNCIAGFIWMLAIGIWQAAIPLAALTGIFGYMTFRDIRAVAKS